MYDDLCQDLLILLTTALGILLTLMTLKHVLSFQARVHLPHLPLSRSSIYTSSWSPLNISEYDLTYGKPTQFLIAIIPCATSTAGNKVSCFTGVTGTFTEGTGGHGTHLQQIAAALYKLHFRVQMSISICSQCKNILKGNRGNFARNFPHWPGKFIPSSEARNCCSKPEFTKTRPKIAFL